MEECKGWENSEAGGNWHLPTAFPCKKGIITPWSHGSIRECPDGSHKHRPRFWTRHTGENTGPEVAQATVTSPEAFVNFKAEDMVNSLGRHLAEHWCGCFRSCFWGDFEEVLMLLMSLLAGDAG